MGSRSFIVWGWDSGGGWRENPGAWRWSSNANEISNPSNHDVFYPWLASAIVLALIEPMPQQQRGVEGGGCSSV